MNQIPKRRAGRREEMILKNAIKILREELRPRRIVLFGSRVKETQKKGSDFDLALDCRVPPLADACRIREKLGERSGLYHIDLVYLPAVSKDFRNLILSTGKIVYARGS